MFGNYNELKIEKIQTEKKSAFLKFYTAHINFSAGGVCYIFYVLSLIFFLFSPLVSFVFSILALIIFSTISNKAINITLVSLAIISLLLIFASRNYVDELENDLSIYYFVYQGFANGDYSEFFRFGSGLEIGWTALYSVIAYFLPNITAIQLSIINSAICSLLLVIFIYTYIYQKIPNRDQGLVSALIVLFLSMSTLGYLQRQAIATIFLIYMIVQDKNRKTFFFLFLASVFHLTSLPIGLAYIFLRKRISNNNINKYIIFFFLGFILFRFYFYDLINYFMNIDRAFIGVEKFNYYSVVDMAIASKRFLILVFPLLFLVIVSDTTNDVAYMWRGIALFSCVSYIALIGIPLLSERLNFILLYFYGFFIYLFSRKNLNMLYLFLAAYFVFFLYEKAGILINGNLFWQRYDMFSIEPFYYIYYL